MNKSLGRRLLYILLLLTLCVWTTVSALIWIRGTSAIERQIDNQLRIMVSTVSYTADAFITAGFPGAPKVSLLDFEIVDSKEGSVYIVEMPEEAMPVVLNVWAKNTLQAMTTGSPLFKPPHLPGLSDHTLQDGSQWRIIRTQLGDSSLWLVAGVNKEVLAAESKQLLFAILSPLLAGLLLMVPLIFYAVRNGLSPLRNLEEQINARSSSDLHAVETADVPAEVAPVVDALNRLLEQLGTTLEKEKRITADAAHELQTPLAAIKTEVQLALSQAPQENSNLLLRIIERVNRASHAVKQLTALSRLEASAQSFTQQVDLHAIVAKCLQLHAPELNRRGIVISCNDCHPLVSGNSEMMTILVDNLVRNVLNHAQENSRAEVTFTDVGGATMRMENRCATISEEDWSLITQRFYRIPGSQGNGSGLGMSIAQRICELHNARFEIGKRDSGDGFSVTIDFQPPAEAL